MAGKRIVLFLCTGNYFRSRFAEELFNHWAGRLALPWSAESRGLMRDMTSLKEQNVGRISRHTLNALAMRGISPSTAERWPQPVTREEILGADRVIALKESEHRPMVETHFPDLLDRIEFWGVDDIDVAPAARGIQQAEQNLLQLVQLLRRGT